MINPVVYLVRFTIQTTEANNVNIRHISYINRALRTHVTYQCNGAAPSPSSSNDLLFLHTKTMPDAARYDVKIHINSRNLFTMDMEIHNLGKRANAFH